MILHEIVRALERVEEAQREILALLETREAPARDDKWLQNGIDNIMAYEAGKRKEE